jgi:hypothetical protein
VSTSTVPPGHSPRHTAQLFLSKNYNLTAVSYDRGVLEETMINLEVFVTCMFESMRVIARAILMIPKKEDKPAAGLQRYNRRASFQDMVRWTCSPP